MTDFAPTHVTMQDCNGFYEKRVSRGCTVPYTIGSSEIIPAGTEVEKLGLSYGPGSDVVAEYGVRLADGRERRIGTGVGLQPIAIARVAQKRDALLTAVARYREAAEAEFGSNDEEHNRGVDLADAVKEFVEALDG